MLNDPVRNDHVPNDRVRDDHAAWGHTTSTGLSFTHHTVVDTHFRACQGPYLDLLGLAPLTGGQHILDAGCGAGDFLPALAGITGPTGRITAVDLAPENTALAAERARTLPCPIDVEQASLLHLPYPDNTFDAVWCSNTTQYLDDTELAAALAELTRVTRPGGTLTIKDLDAHLITARPTDPYLFTDFFRAAATQPGYARQLLRTRDTYRHLKAAGLTNVTQHTLLIEHHTPLTPDAHAFYTTACAQLAAQALDIGLSQQWHAYLLDP
ncbi:class I SAM-dependent methyltransferase, partial [Streptomyces purpureus]